jgi:hypothetical protein
MFDHLLQILVNVIGEDLHEVTSPPTTIRGSVLLMLITHTHTHTHTLIRLKFLSDDIPFSPLYV